MVSVADPVDPSISSPQPNSSSANTINSNVNNNANAAASSMANKAKRHYRKSTDALPDGKSKRFSCTVPGCGKTYNSNGGLRYHLAHAKHDGDQHNTEYIRRVFDRHEKDSQALKRQIEQYCEDDVSQDPNQDMSLLQNISVDQLLNHPLVSPSYTLALARAGFSQTPNVIAAEALLKDFVRVHRLSDSIAAQEPPEFTDEHARLLQYHEHMLTMTHRQLFQDVQVHSQGYGGPITSEASAIMFPHSTQ
jgi:hypothetical protein